MWTTLTEEPVTVQISSMHQTLQTVGNNQSLISCFVNLKDSLWAECNDWSDLLIKAPHTSLSTSSSWHLLPKNTHFTSEKPILNPLLPFFSPLVSLEKVLFLERLPLMFFYSRNYFNYTCLKQPETLCHICQSGIKHLKQLRRGDYMRN